MPGMVQGSGDTEMNETWSLSSRPYGLVGMWDTPVWESAWKAVWVWGWGSASTLGEKEMVNEVGQGLELKFKG